MDKREEVLRDALAKNLDEIQKWELYEKESVQATENLDMFSKTLYVDIMVPVGKKAFIPGQLIHTNEVLVSHYQGYFSKCSAYKASDICQHRIKLAQEHLQKLHRENELWQNKLDKPYVDGAIPTAEECEIIEEYDEEKERLWREKHKIRLREAKERERKEIALSQKQEANKCKDHIEIIKKLEDIELTEVLEDELGKLELKDVIDNEILQKLISGEIPTSNKGRISHQKSLNLKNTNNILPNIVKKSELMPILPELTNNNCQINPELLNRDGHDSDSFVASDIPEEIMLIEEQAKYLPHEDQIGFYQYQLQIINQKILSISSEQFEEKLHLYDIRDHIEELLECMSGEGSDEVESEHISDIDDTDNTVPSTTLKNRRISFASKDETLEFHKNESVADMILKSPIEDVYKRDVVQLGETANISEHGFHDDNHPTILNKVENNLAFFFGTQSMQDADIVNKIIDSSTLNNHHRTLRITFKHSDDNSSKKIDEAETESSPFIPRTPADLCKMISHPEQPIICKEDSIKSPVLKEADRSTAYTDLRAQFSNPESVILPSIENRSILRNKSAVEKETRTAEPKALNKNEPNKASSKKSKMPSEENYITAYDKVMGDIVENQRTDAEALPNCKFIDAHTPKKRVSRFKQMRANKV